MTARSRSLSRRSLDFTRADVIAQLTCWLEMAGVHAIDIEHNDQQISIVMTGGTAHVSRHMRSNVPVGASVMITSPSVGHFLAYHPARPDGGPQEGESVNAGDVVGFVKIGPLLLGVAAPQDGVLGEALVNAGDAVGYGTPLFSLEQP
ncbi:hypothetical protein GOZ80_10625 [Agrobacterium vitis]|uniref:Lipoyl-binding domain-containing protein n=1 Tax=Agrobacterium vitis TaxID=373 RepID=A0A1S2E0I4_AGRVI|nr:biotin/lipoyl-containing protein [Agrobacterium vitis]MUO80368.1 hypothetical protein [Agrobacterium vitis]MUO94832.1 hypothetical protein [Agrobacterium vitis]MUP05406.1 hypothetical protein [Agrobacterium vitis]MUZ81600.1 hypothetical protein [Agrobacterium vitis]MVA56652.1 hypothetical protein [Agrobacterium vitis]